MKRYVKATTLTTEQVAEEFKKTGYFYGRYTTRRGKKYDFLITEDGRVEAREQYTDQKSTGGYRIREKYLYKIPKEMQNYIIEHYGQQLSELGITLRF